ncbi:MAG: hypothetical protein D6781_14740, partial [Verrucomicrobia bacterium]
MDDFGGRPYPGTTFERAVEVSGTGPLKIAWYRDGRRLFGENGPSVTLPGASNQDILSSYLVEVSGPGGTTALQLHWPHVSAEIELADYERFLEVYEGEPFELAFRFTDTKGAPVAGSCTWYRDVGHLSDETESRLVRDAATVEDDGIYRMKFLPEQGAGGPFGASFRYEAGPVDVRVVRPVEGAEALGAVDGLSWRTEVRAPWRTVADPDGARGNVLRSAQVEAEEASVLRVDVGGPTVVRFDAKVSSEAHADGLSVRVDGEEVLFLSGETGWASHDVAVPGGFHRIDWVYHKDEMGRFGEDAAWIDAVSVQAEPPRLMSPRVLHGVSGEDLEVLIEAEGAMTMAVEGLPEGVSFDPLTRSLKGRVDEPGDYVVTVVIGGGGEELREQVTLRLSPTLLPFPEYTYPNLYHPRAPGKEGNRIIRAAGRFVAVGGNRLLAHSPDGVRWRYVVPDWPPALMKDVTWGDGCFVAVGEVGIVYTSADGEQWTRRKNLPAYTFNAVTFADGKFVAVGEHGIVLVSDDMGQTWQSRFVPTRTNLIGIGYVDGTFRAVDAAGRIFGSADT